MDYLKNNDIGKNNIDRNTNAGNSNSTDDLIINPEFLEAVYAVVEQIPKGKVATYGQIGDKAGYPRSAREVGHAMSHGPAGRNLPYHRVVNKQGTLAPDYAFGGKEVQRKMLEEEGITFFDDGIINMEKHLWDEYEQLSFF